MPPATISQVASDLARSIAALFFAKARSSMTAPMKLDRSVTSPMVRPSTSAASSSLKPFSQMERGMYAREAAEHFWPWYSKAPRVMAVLRIFGSALGWATMKSLPPVSPTRRG